MSRLVRSFNTLSRATAVRSCLFSSTLTRSAPSVFTRTITSSTSSSTPIRAGAGAAAATATASNNAMFCRQCEQTSNQTGCKVVGVCGKTPEVAALQDLLVFQLQGISQYAVNLKDEEQIKKVGRFVLAAMFSTLTNVNFDADAIQKYVQQAAAIKAEIAKSTSAASKCDAATYNIPANASQKDLISEGRRVANLETRKASLGEDLAGLAEMVIYGVKGTCAYAEHALMLNVENTSVYKNVFTALTGISSPGLDVPKVLGLIDLVGSTNLTVMGMLDEGATSKFGHPVPTSVSTTPKVGPSILVSGHDLNDLEHILQQCEGKGINVYTHGEMLPAHAYPGLKKYKSLAGHYGGPWQLQKFEFAQFPGPIIMTTNCIIEPMKSYKNRIFTRSVTGWPGVKHIEGQDYSVVLQSALDNGGFEQDDIKESKPLMTGFARNAIVSVADKVLDAVKGGAIKHFFVIGGCDGSEGERSYFTELAKSTPKDSVILTLGCGKYRFNRENLGEIGGIPRLLDLGQCNDAYSGIQVALTLAKALNTDVNSLPLSFAVSWFEQKAVAVLLTLLHLNIQNIRLGTHLPAFVTPNVLKVLIDKYQIKQANHKDVAGDLKAMLSNH